MSAVKEGPEWKPFRALKDRSGRALVTDDLEYAVESVIMQGKETTKTVLTRLTSKPWDDWREAYFNLPTFDNSKQQQLLAHETYLNKMIPPADQIACKQCGSLNVKVTGKQTRSLDEGGTVFAKCQACGLQFNPE